MNLIKKLINNAIVNSKTNNDETPLTLVVLKNLERHMTNTIKTLIESNANINEIITSISRSLLNTIIIHENINLIDYLVKNKADVNLRSGSYNYIPF